MLAIELLRILLGVGAYVLGFLGIIELFIGKGDSNLANSFLILAGITLVIMFNI